MDTELKSRVRNVSCCWPQHVADGIDEGELAGLTEGLKQGNNRRDRKK